MAQVVVTAPHAGACRRRGRRSRIIVPGGPWRPGPPVRLATMLQHPH